MGYIISVCGFSKKRESIEPLASQKKEIGVKFEETVSAFEI